MNLDNPIYITPIISGSMALLGSLGAMCLNNIFQLQRERATWQRETLYALYDDALNSLIAATQAAGDPDSVKAFYKLTGSLSKLEAVCSKDTATVLQEIGTTVRLSSSGGFIQMNARPQLERQVEKLVHLMQNDKQLQQLLSNQ